MPSTPPPPSDPIQSKPGYPKLNGPKLNYRPDPDDPRDRLAQAILPRLWKAATTSSGTYIIDSDVPIYNQGHLGTCVAHATGSAFEILQSKANPSVAVVPISKLFLNWVSCNKDGAKSVESFDEGTYVRSAFNSLATTGMPPSESWPYDQSKFAERPDLAAFELGYDSRITGYYRIKASGSSLIDQIEWAVRADHPVVFGTQVSRSFVDYDGRVDAVWHPPSRPIGGHCMCIDGVRSTRDGHRELRLRNSWASSWGQNGFAWAAEDWITDPWSMDFWVATLLQ